MAKIKAVTLADKDGNLKYPRTYTKLVANSDGEDLDAVLSNKANTNGYYDTMSVGVADNLTGRGEAIEREFVFDQSAGVTTSILEEDTARIESIQGNTLVYNQLHKRTKNLTLNGVTTTVVNETTFILNGTPTNVGGVYYSDQFTRVAGHKYLLLATQGAEDTRDWYVTDQSQGRSDGGQPVIFPTSSTANTSLLIKTTVEGVTFNNKKIEILLIDLTKMFGAGNEPTTAEEAEKIISQLNVPDGYNAGQLISNNTTAIKTVGFNAWDGVAEAGFINYVGENQTDPTYMRSTNYIPVIPQTEYYPNIYQQYNHLGAANFRIFFYDKEKKFISYKTKYANWNETNVFETPANASYMRFTFQLPIADYKNDICINIVNTGYRNGDYEPYIESTRQLPTVEGGLKSAGTVYDELRYNHLTDKWEYVKRVGERAYAEGDDSDTSVVTDGTTTYYALDEVVTTELDTDLSPDYDVEDWGTEEAIQVTPSAPFKGMIKYGFNAVDQIRGNKLNIDDLLTRVTALEAQLVSLTTNTQNDETTA